MLLALIAALALLNPEAGLRLEIGPCGYVTAYYRNLDTARPMPSGEPPNALMAAVIARGDSGSAIGPLSAYGSFTVRVPDGPVAVGIATALVEDGEIRDVSFQAVATADIPAPGPDCE